METKINAEATLMNFTIKEITVVGWCKMHRFDRGLFYKVVNNTIVWRRTAVNARKILEALRSEGLLVADETPLEEAKHVS